MIFMISQSAKGLCNQKIRNSSQICFISIRISFIPFNQSVYIDDNKKKEKYIYMKFISGFKESSEDAVSFKSNPI